MQGDPAWECVQTKYRLTFELMENCKNKHATLDATSALRPAPAQMMTGGYQSLKRTFTDFVMRLSFDV